MSISALNWALNVRVESSSQKLVLLLLANFADERGRSWPSQKVIAQKACLSVRSVVTALADLEKAGRISREARWRPGGSRGTDIIHLVMSSANAQNVHPSSKGEEIAPLGKSAKSVGQTCKIGTTKGANASDLTTFEPSVEPSETHSEANASGGVAAQSEVTTVLSALDLLWYEGKPMLIEMGLAPKLSGDMIGQWLVRYRDAAKILDAIRSARQRGGDKPIAIIVALLEGSGGRDSAGQKRRPRGMVGVLAADYGGLH